MRQWLRFPTWGHAAITNVIHARSNGQRGYTVCGLRAGPQAWVVLRGPAPGEVCMRCAANAQVAKDVEAVAEWRRLTSAAQ